MGPKTETHSQSSSYRGQKATIADLSILEKLDAIPAVLTILANVFAALFTRSLRSKEQLPDSYFRYVALTAMRTFTRRMTPRQQHYVALPTDDAYLAWCKTKGVTPNSEVLEDGTRAHWIGSSKAEKLILNFHGGGYTLPAGPEHFEFMSRIITLLNKQGKSVSCLFLSYDLAPTAIYPRQLQQASFLLTHVLQDLKIPPQNILLTGDSAGANLAVALLSHISHSHPSTSVPIPPIKLDTPLCGAVLISPWISFSLSDPSFTTNAYKDCIGPIAGKQWSSAFLAEPWPHSSKSDYYNQAITAPEEWWKGLMVEKVFVVAGEEEVLVDGIQKWEAKLRKGMGEGKVEILVAKGEYHDQPTLDVQLGYKESEEGEQARRIKSWISSKL